MNLRKVKRPPDAQLHINEILNQARRCSTLNCLGEQCYKLKPYVPTHFISTVGDFAKEYIKDLKRRNWYQNQNGIEDINNNNYRALTSIDNEIFIYEKYDVESGKIGFDHLHELCHVSWRGRSEQRLRLELWD